MSRHPASVNVLEAFSRTVHDHPSGVGDLAAAIGMVPGTLYNKANTNDDRHPPTLTDAVLVIRSTGNPLIAQALAHAAGGAFLPLPKHAVRSNDDLLRLVSKWMAEQGEFFREFDAAMADGTISPREQKELTTQAHRVVLACMDLVGRLESSSKGAR